MGSPQFKSNKQPYVLIEFSTRKNLMSFSVSKITLYSIRNWAAFSVKGTQTNFENYSILTESMQA